MLVMAYQSWHVSDGILDYCADVSVVVARHWSGRWLSVGMLRCGTRACTQKVSPAYEGPLDVQV